MSARRRRRFTPNLPTDCDLRAAAQEAGTLRLAPLQKPLAKLIHLCVRDQVVTGHPTSVQLPACEELWNWNCGQKGDFPTPGLGRSVLAAANGYTLADLSGQWVYEGGWGTLELTNNQLTSVNLTGCRSLQTIKLDGNVLDGTQVDGVLAEVASWGTTGFHLDLAGTNAAPSAAGRRDAADLRDRGWQVTLAPG